jgi:hypothetical protein
MIDDDIDYLKAILTTGLKVWWRNSGVLEPVSEIGEHCEERGPVAYLRRGTGHYVALDNCEPSDFIITTGDLADWPSRWEG